MTQQMSRYNVSERRSVKIMAPNRSEKIPVAALLGSIAFVIGPPAHAENLPIGDAYFQFVNSNSSNEVKIEFNACETLNEIKSLSGLTWSQIAQFLNISRKTVHDWTLGQVIRENNQAKLNDLADRVRSMAGLPKFKIRSALVSQTSAKRHDNAPLLISDNTPARKRPKALVGSIIAK